MRSSQVRSLVIIGIMAVLSWPAQASEKITVEQLEQILAKHAAEPHPAKHDSASQDEVADISDGDLLQQLDGDDELTPRVLSLELTERLSTNTMFRWIWKYHLGPHMQQALEQLSDCSALLKLPDQEEPRLPAPDAAAQQATLQAARTYTLRELSHLPNFVATRTTTRFDDAPPPLKYWQTTAGNGLHRVGSIQRQITFRDGKEVTDEPPAPTQTKFQGSTLESRGELGTEAAVVLMDVEHGDIAFSHWEQTMAGLAAVYQYSVPREASHYQVNDDCREHGSFQNAPAYHGMLALDPRTGAIFRMTLEAESKPGDPVSHVASVIEYGPVVLGRHRSICPLRSLVFMVEEANGCSHGGRKLQKPVTMINQTIFSNYHRFGSSSTIIFNQAENGQTVPGEPRKPENTINKSTPEKPAVAGQNKRP